LSVFADRGDWVYEDYVSVMKDLNHHAALNKALQAKLAESEAAVARTHGRPWWRRWLGR
jgi:hypothetical protein